LGSKSRLNKDRFYPMLFNIVADMLAILIACAKKVRGLITNLVDTEIFILQYKDDIILFMEYATEKENNYPKLK
jgi:hypothetical protein